MTALGLPEAAPTWLSKDTSRGRVKAAKDGAALELEAAKADVAALMKLPGTDKHTPLIHVILRAAKDVLTARNLAQLEDAVRIRGQDESTDSGPENATMH
jgi:hypothetical protein